MKNIFISVLNFNGEKNTLMLIDSLKKIKLNSSEVTILIIDNASESLPKITESSIGKFSLKFIKNNKNLGFSGGHNVGIKYALENEADIVVFLNNDTIVDNNFLNEMLAVFESDEKIGILVPKIYFMKGHEFHKGRYRKEDLGKIIWYAGGKMDWDNVIGYNRGVDEKDIGQYDNLEETELATGCCMMVKKEVFDRVGIFDEKYYLYYEDADLSIRCKDAGFKIVFVPNSIVWHKNAGSAGGSGSILQDYYISRNRLLFGMKYAPLKSKMALLKESINILLKGRYWQKRGILDFFLGKFNKGSFNI